MPYVAKYDMVVGRDPKSGAPFRVRRRIDKRAPEDMLKDVVYAIRRACRVLDGARQAGLLGEADPSALLLMAGVRIRQGELRRELPDLIQAAHAAERILAHDHTNDLPTHSVVVDELPALPHGKPQEGLGAGAMTERIPTASEPADG
jgi:hypothetical protein